MSTGSKIDTLDEVKPSRKVIRAKAAFYITLLVVIATSTVVFLIGPKNIINDFFTVSSILSMFQFLFLTFGLYKGFTIHDDLPDLVRKIKFTHFFDIFPSSTKNIDLDFSEGPLGIVFSIIAWFLITIVLSLLISFLFATIWALILLFVTALYWIFYRALRLVFIKSDECKGNVIESLKFGILFTILYTVWFYGIIYFSKVIKQN